MKKPLTRRATRVDSTDPSLRAHVSGPAASAGAIQEVLDHRIETFFHFSKIGRDHFTHLRIFCT